MTSLGVLRQLRQYIRCLGSNKQPLNDDISTGDQFIEISFVTYCYYLSIGEPIAV